MPDGIIIYFRTYAALYSLAFTVVFPSDTEAFFVVLQHIYHIFSSGITSTLTFFLTTLNQLTHALIIYVILAGIAPWVIYCVLRIPVLTNCPARWPDTLKDWFMGIPSRCFKGPRAAWRLHKQCFVNLLIPYAAHLEAPYWTKQNFQQLYYLRAAVSQLYHSPGEVFSPGFSRWLWHYCAPVWSAYVILLLFAFFSNQPDWFQVFLGFSWWAISAVFFLREVRALDAHLIDHVAARRLVPQSMWPDIDKYRTLQRSIPKWGVGALNVSSALALLAFLEVLQIVEKH